MAGDPEDAIEAWERVHAAAVGAGEDERAADAAEQVATLLLYTGLLSPRGGGSGGPRSMLLEHPDSPVHGGLAIVHRLDGGALR